MLSQGIRTKAATADRALQYAMLTRDLGYACWRLYATPESGQNAVSFTRLHCMYVLVINITVHGLKDTLRMAHDCLPCGHCDARVISSIQGSTSTQS